ncbi:MAG: elongation factor Ts [Gammaproteobacteria bacterium CG_4_10_14_0_8_um_filter_38_16]|nr:MAG: elongation factor Ts [Gammaproteobacteria bacterium CG_4_10_14_0_8_um_filter_38_16]PJA02671.1 MAG: elongation factor Ts [Gammaproteobacteria bacterium CG_4_10_14_0_2_um_filter_38_22]PJB09861.1 MAG: elongation factor Ts [Gammaproteobacteria bacterium CG_4_9_14_3_um_filter_38_9]
MSEVTASMVKTLREMTDAGMMECKKALVETKGDMELAVDYLRKNGQAKAAKRAGKIAAEGAIVVAVSADKMRACMVEVNCETDFVARDENFKSFADQLAQVGLSINTDDVATLMSHTVEGKTVEAVRETLVAKIGENVQARRMVTLSASGCVGFYLHGDRIGVLVAIDKNNPELAKDIAMHVAATNPAAIDSNSLSPDVIAKERSIVAAQAETSGKPANIIEKMVEGRLQKFVQEVCLVYQPFVKNPDQKVQDLLKAAGATVLSFVRFEVGEGVEKPVTDFAAEVSETLKGI